MTGEHAASIAQRRASAAAAMINGQEAVPASAASQRLRLDAAVQPRRTGLHLPADLNLNSWCRIGKQLHLISDSSSWWLGDWLTYGIQRYPDHYRDAVRETGLDYQTLRNYAWVARKFSLSRRRDKLSFQHHSEVAAMPERDQDYWLDRAEYLAWSRSELRKRIRAEVQQGANPGADHCAEMQTVTIQVAPDKHRQWQRAAVLARQDLADWISEILDQAALSLIDGDSLRPANSLHRRGSGRTTLQLLCADR